MVMDLAPGMRVLEGTTGAAGHGREFVAALGAQGLYVGLDQDAEILEHAEATLGGVRASADAPRIVLRHASFADLDAVLADLEIDSVDRVFLDLGVSSLQLDSPERGFSFMRDAALDMRMNRAPSQPTAAEWLQAVPREELERVLFEYGGERHSRRVAAGICEARARHGALERTSQLVDVVVRSLPPKARHGRIHCATRTFQAVRMAVNDEVGALERGLDKACAALADGGRLAVISFHSVEDRIVKRFVRQRMQPLHKKPIEAGVGERSRNPRSRSARLRCGIRRVEA